MSQRCVQAGLTPVADVARETQNKRADDLRVATPIRRAAAGRRERLRELKTENAKLKRMVAEREMSIETLKEINRRKW